MQQDTVTQHSDTEAHLSDRLSIIRNRLYAKFGHGALSQAARELGVPRERVSSLLSDSSREIIDDLEALSQSGEA